jgi:hypothetical protein
VLHVLEYSFFVSSIRIITGYRIKSWLHFEQAVLYTVCNVEFLFEFLFIVEASIVLVVSTTSIGASKYQPAPLLKIEIKSPLTVPIIIVPPLPLSLTISVLCCVFVQVV